jgi:hypothetical protein
MSEPQLHILKLRTLVTRRVSEGKTDSGSSLAYASGFHFCWKTDNAKLQKLHNVSPADVRHQVDKKQGPTYQEKTLIPGTNG